MTKKPTQKHIAPKKPKIDLDRLDANFYTKQNVYAFENADEKSGAILLTKIMTPQVFSKIYANPQTKQMLKMGFVPSTFADAVETLLENQDKQSAFFKSFDMALDHLNLKKAMLEMALTKNYDETLGFFLLNDALTIPKQCRDDLAKRKSHFLTIVLQKDAPYFIDDRNKLIIKCRFPKNTLTEDESKDFLKAQANPYYDRVFSDDVIDEKKEFFRQVQEASLKTLTAEEIEERKGFLIDFSAEEDFDEFVCELPLESLCVLTDILFDHPYIWEDVFPSDRKSIHEGLPYFLMFLNVFNGLWIDRRIALFEKAIHCNDNESESLVFSLKTLVDAEKTKRNSAVEKAVLTALASTLDAEWGSDRSFLVILRAIGDQIEILYEKEKKSRLFAKLKELYENFDIYK